VSDRKVAPWRVLTSRILFEDRWLRLRNDRCETSEGAVVPSYHVLECADGVNIVALTGEGRLLLAREYRHGCGEVVTGIPAGMIEATDASPEAAARRELLEETGYGGGQFTPMLTCWANAARQTNRVTSFLAVGVEPLSSPSLDPAEAIDLIHGDLPEVFERLRRGEWRMQSTHVAALWSVAAAILTGAAAVAGDLRDRLRAALSPP
jgi:ADP-ribose pyrophosphatase